jgi:hypothetical protein
MTLRPILAQPKFRKNLLAVFVEGTTSFIAIILPHINILLKISIIGFLFGFSLASSFAAYHLLEEYQRASAALQTSIEELRVSTEKVSIGWNTCYWTLNNISFRSRSTLDE